MIDEYATIWSGILSWDDGPLECAQVGELDAIRASLPDWEDDDKFNELFDAMIDPMRNLAIVQCAGKA